MPATAKEIIRKYGEGRLSDRPEYYLGRGNNSGDLDSSYIEKIFTGIQKEIGDPAAQAFVAMVADLNPDASATTFLSAVYRLEESDWQYAKKNIPSEEETLGEAASKAMKANDRGGMDIAGFAMLGVFNTRNEPVERITGDFLKNHDVKPNKAKPPQGTFAEKYLKEQKEPKRPKRIE